MNKIFSLVAFGALFAIFPLIIFYAGIFVNYFSYYEIKEFFNNFFMQNLNLYLYLIFGLFSGFAFIANTNFFRFLYLICLILMSLTLIPNIGKIMGEKLFFKNTRILINGQSQNINLIYKDKYKIYYNTKDDPKTIRLDIKK